jgi:hypothetical protein
MVNISLLSTVLVAMFASRWISVVGDEEFEFNEFNELEYWENFYRWYRGGAWMFHDSDHPCEYLNQNCTFLPKSNESLVHLLVNTTIINQLDRVKIQYKTRDIPQQGDFIGIYCVDQEFNSDAVVEDDDFFDYIWLNASLNSFNASNTISRNGNFTVGPLVNMRCSYQFRYVRNIDTLKYKVIGESPHIEMAKGHTEPVGVHLAVVGRPNEMRVMWTSGRVNNPQVRYGLSPQNLTKVVIGVSDTYTAEDLCGADANIERALLFRHPGYLHDALMVNLQRDTTYFYQVSSANGVWSKIFKFKIPPKSGQVPSDPIEPHSFFVFGDLGQSILRKSRNRKRTFTSIYMESIPSKSNDTVIASIEKDLMAPNGSSYLAVLHVGDLSYAKGRQYIWDQFGPLIEPIASSLPYMVALGNHEYDYMSGGEGKDLSGAGKTNGFHPPEGNYKNDSNGECGVPAAKRFHMPDNGNQMFWYSFEMGLVHHTVISSEHNFTKGSEMYTWLEKDLKQVNRQKTPWLFLYLHRPLYCSEDYKSDYDISLLLRQYLEPLLIKNHVDVIFSGHYHAYERTCAVKEEKCMSTNEEKVLGPIHIMIGSAGAELDDIDYLPKPWSLNAQQEYGYGRMHIYNSTHARFEFLRTRGHVVSDSTWIYSHHDW